MTTTTRAPEREDGLTTVTCPSCATTGYVDPAGRSSAGFCLKCDYPLFWARERVVQAPGTGNVEEALRRLPGTGGRDAIASIACPVCTELNPVTGVYCIRCDSDLRPPAVVVAPVVVAPPVVYLPPPPAPEPEPEILWWPWIALAVLTVALLITLVVVLDNQDYFS